MAKLLLALTILIALGVLLWGSWQWGKKPFVSVLSMATLALLVVVAIGIWHSEQDNLIRMSAPEGVTLSLNEHRASGRSIRLMGHATNHSERAISRFNVVVTALQCADDGAENRCEPVSSQTLPLDLYLPTDATYPFSLLVTPPARPARADKWTIAIDEVLAFPRGDDQTLRARP